MILHLFKRFVTCTLGHHDPEYESPGLCRCRWCKRTLEVRDARQTRT